MTKFVNARFEYTDAKWVINDFMGQASLYILMEHIDHLMPRLLFNTTKLNENYALNGPIINKDHYHILSGGTELKDALNAAKRFAENNPNWFEKRFHRECTPSASGYSEYQNGDPISEANVTREHSADSFSTDVTNLTLQIPQRAPSVLHNDIYGHMETPDICGHMETADICGHMETPYICGHMETPNSYGDMQTQYICGDTHASDNRPKFEQPAMMDEDNDSDTGLGDLQYHHDMLVRINKEEYV